MSDFITTLTYDFEASSRNPHEAHPLQLAYVLHNSKKVLKRDFYIIFPKTFDRCNDEELQALEFNGISRDVMNPDMSISERRKKYAYYRNHSDISQQSLAKRYYIDIEEHNSLSREPFDVIVKLLNDIKEFESFDILQGFNNTSYDDVVLDEFFRRYHGVSFSKLFIFKVNDVYLNLTNLATRFGLDFPDKSKIGGQWFQHFFRAQIYDKDYPRGRFSKKGEGLFKLENLHKRVYGENSLNFHTAISDCIATIDLNRHYNDYWKPKYIPEQKAVHELIRVCSHCQKSISDLQIVTSSSGNHYHRNFSCLKAGLEIERELAQKKEGDVQ